MRRPSVASLDSGAESPVYGEEPSASADRISPVARPPWAGGGRRAVWPVRAVEPAQQAGCDPCAGSALTSRLPGFSQALASGGQGSARQVLRARSVGQRTRRRGGLRGDHLAPGSAGRLDASHRGNGGADVPGAGRRGGAATRRNSRSVGYRPAKRQMVCKGHPCVYAADGDPMARHASSWAVPRGLRSLCKLTDAHGREG